MADVSTTKTSADAKVTSLTPIAFAANVQRSVNFYNLLGVKLPGQLKTSSGDIPWAHVLSEPAELMFARATEPGVFRQPAGLFYLSPPNPGCAAGTLHLGRCPRPAHPLSRLHAERRSPRRGSRRLHCADRPGWLTG
jgi:hypothetical protein